jgi:hypothetical protein
MFWKKFVTEITPWKVIILMDTTYCKRAYGYMIFRIRDPISHSWRNILRYKVDHETNNQYREWIVFLQSKGFEIIAIVMDWRKWLLWWFGSIPTQLCIAHQQRTITQYLTRKPKLKPSLELRDISMHLWKLSKSTITQRLQSRHERNKDWLYEKNENKNYIHVRVVKAYKSLVRNMSYLYVFEEYFELWIPSTTNSLEAVNSRLKTKRRIHRWLREDRKQQLTNYYLYYHKNSSTQKVNNRGINTKDINTKS